MTNKNMVLWDQVCETDPAITRRVNQRGGFTAICAQAQRKTATELWGPYGTDWGLNDCKFSLIEDASGKPVEICLDASFYYPHDKGDGVDHGVKSFPISVDMTFKPGNESRKKLMTDATTKALSMLGFNSDVFEGRFDDNKYVNDMGEKFRRKRMSAETTTSEGDGDPIPPMEEDNPVPSVEDGVFYEKMFGQLIDKGIELLGEDEFEVRYKRLLKYTFDVPSWKSIPGDENKKTFYRHLTEMVESISNTNKGEQQ